MGKKLLEEEWKGMTAPHPYFLPFIFFALLLLDDQIQHGLSYYTPLFRHQLPCNTYKQSGGNTYSLVFVRFYTGFPTSYEKCSCLLVTEMPLLLPHFLATHLNLMLDSGGTRLAQETLPLPCCSSFCAVPSPNWLRSLSTLDPFSFLLSSSSVLHPHRSPLSLHSFFSFPSHPSFHSNCLLGSLVLRPES